MPTTSFANGQSYSTDAQWGYEDDREHDDLMSAEDYDARCARRDGWQTATWDGR